MAEKTYSLKELDEMMALVQKHTPASTTLTAAPLHGVFHGNANNYGIFSTPGVRPQRYSALTRPNSMLNLVGLERSNVYTEKLEIMTGQTLVTCTNATSWCGDPPTPGQLKVCKQNFNWGQYYIKGRLNAIPEIGQFKDRADVPAQILNAGPTGNPLIPDLMYRLSDTLSQLQYELFTIGVQTERTLESILFTGNNTLASTSTECGWIKEFYGFDNWIKTGFTDADTGITCPAVDSAVVDYSANISTTTADGRNIAQVIMDTAYGLRQRAAKMGMADTQWVIAMREELWRPLVDRYSCLYNIYGCTGAQYEEVNTNAADVRALREQMYTGMYLWIDGQPWPVVFSEGIPQITPAANTFESDMYFIPVSWAGQALTRIQFFPMDNPQAMEFANFAGMSHEVLNGGLWLAGKEETAMCKELHFAAKMRLILETPHLAGRIDDLQYSFNAPIRNAIPGASFYADGGVSIRT